MDIGLHGGSRLKRQPLANRSGNLIATYYASAGVKTMLSRLLRATFLAADSDSAIGPCAHQGMHRGFDVGASIDGTIFDLRAAGYVAYAADSAVDPKPTLL